MKILIVEDNTYRIDFFKSWFLNQGHNNLIFAKSLPEALNLKNKYFDLICLDFDLDESNTQNSITFLNEYLLCHPNSTTKYIIHSMNITGGNALEQIFRANHIKPFRKLFRDLKETTINQILNHTK